MNVSFYSNLFTKKPYRLCSIDEPSPNRSFALITDDDDMRLFSPEMMFQMVFDSSGVAHPARGDDDPRAGIIISASGMCDSGRIKHHLKHHLWRKESHIVIIGYQGEGTIGRRLVDGAKTVRLFGEEIAVKAHIHTLGGFSAHADQKGLLEWLSHFNNPRLEVFVNHGEEKTSMGLGQIICQKFNFKTIIPQW